MSAPQVIANYEALLTLTRLMHEAAAQGQWEPLISIEGERNKLLAEIKVLDAQTRLDTTFSQRKDALLQSILAADAQTRDLVKTWMDQFQITMQSASQEMRLLKKYGA